jgi:hypothetical protein
MRLARSLLALLALLALPGSAAAADYGAAVRATPNLVAYWPLDEPATSTTVADVVAARAATPSSGYALGRPPGIDAGGTSLSLTGTAAANFGNVGALSFAGDRTIEAWVAPGQSSGDRYIVSKGTTSAGYHLYLASGGVPTLQVNGSRASAPALSAGGWHHVVATLTARAMALYVDGRPAGTGTVTNTPATSSQSFWLGRLSRSSSGHFQGGIDEVALYGRALTAAEVAAHFAAGADTSPPRAIFGTTPGAVSDQSSGAFAFAGSKGGVTFTCALDEGAATRCQGTYDYDLLRDGSHALAVTATDRWGTTETTTYSWQVALSAAESAAPVSTFTTTPAALTNSSAAKFTFTGSKARLAFACRLDGGAWTACAGAAAYNNLQHGAHTVEVRATDRWGVVEESPRAFSWFVDLAAPETFVLAHRATTADAGSVALGSEEGASFECRRADQWWGPCPASFAMPFLPASEQLFVRAVDPAGNADPSPAEVVLEPPAAAAPLAFGGGRAAFVIGGNRTVAGLGCSIDGGPLTTCAWPLEFENLSYGSHTLKVVDSSLDVVFPTIAWTNPLPAPRIVGSQFPALLQLGSRRRQATLAVARLPRLLFQSISSGTARVTLRRGSSTVRAWKAPVVQGSNLVRLPRAAWKRLRPGRYGLVVLVTNVAGTSAPLTLRFDAVRTNRR